MTREQAIGMLRFAWNSAVEHTAGSAKEREEAAQDWEEICEVLDMQNECAATATMKQFTITGEFYAENINDAFFRLSEYFNELYNGEDTTVFNGPYRIEVKPVPATQPKKESE